MQKAKIRIKNRILQALYRPKQEKKLNLTKSLDSLERQLEETLTPLLENILK